jgi:hypothetical protein
MTSEWARDNFFVPQIVMGCGLAIAFTGLVALLAQNALDAGALSSPFNLLIRPFVGKSSEARLALDVQGHIAGVARALGSTSTLVNGAQFALNCTPLRKVFVSDIFEDFLPTEEAICKQCGPVASIDFVNGGRLTISEIA